MEVEVSGNGRREQTVEVRIKKKTNLTNNDNKGINTRNYPFYEKEGTDDFKIVSNNGGKIPNFKYDITYIRISMRMKIEGSISFRGIAMTHHIFESALRMEVSSLHHSTVIQWVKRIGYYELQKPKERGNWLIVIDESVMVGQSRLLNIYGLLVEDIPVDRALILQDMESLYVSSRTSWTGDDIGVVIKKLQVDLGNIAYSVSDGGNNLIKACVTTQTTHIYDITHYIALQYQYILKDIGDFQTLSSMMGKMRRKGILSKIAHLLPPNQRVKSRFLNINLLITWSLKALWHIDNQTKSELSELEINELKWVEQYRNLITELIELEQIKSITFSILKNEHFSEKSLLQLSLALGSMEQTVGTKGQSLIHGIRTYYKNHRDYLDKYPRLLCCSDIIESGFGKLKQVISANKMCGFTDIALCLAAFCNDLSDNEIRNAMRFCTFNKVREFSKEHFLQSMFVKRKEFSHTKFDEKSSEIINLYHAKNGANFYDANAA